MSALGLLGTWTLNACKIMALWALFRGFGPLLYDLLECKNCFDSLVAFASYAVFPFRPGGCFTA